MFSRILFVGKATGSEIRGSGFPKSSIDSLSISSLSNGDDASTHLIGLLRESNKTRYVTVVELFTTSINSPTK